jgi:plastocyanin
MAIGVCASLAATSGAASTHRVSVRDDSFSRSSLSIQRGDKVKWSWKNTDDDHNVTSPSSNPVAFHSRTEDGSYTYAHRFSKTGTYKLRCTIHPGSMRITVKVKR